MPGSNLVGTGFNRPPSKLASNKENEPNVTATEKQVIPDDTVAVTSTEQ